MARSSSVNVPALLLAGAALLLLFAPAAHAGAVFEIRESQPASNNDFRFVFGSPAATQLSNFPGAGSVARSGGVGAGSFFKTSAIPLAIFTLNKCTAVAPHIHPNSAETLFVLTGKIRIHMFRGEEDLNTVRVVECKANEACIIPQGAYHVVENVSTSSTPTKFLQIFDHPQGGAVFAAPALAALPRNIVNSAFSAPIFGAGVTGKGVIIKVTGCSGSWNPVGK